MRVGFFGGSFDPPHRAHLLVAQAARDGFHLDRVLLAPTGRQPLKPQGSTAPFLDRLAMTALLCRLDPAGRLQASNLDAPLEGHAQNDTPNYTVDTLQRLRSSLVDTDEVFLITGADAFLDLRKWREPDRLLTLAEWIVISRPGIEPGQVEHLQLTTKQRARVHWLNGVCDPVSATGIRSRLAAGLDCSALVPEPVLDYIGAHALYTPA